MRTATLDAHEDRNRRRHRPGRRRHAGRAGRAPVPRRRAAPLRVQPLGRPPPEVGRRRGRGRGRRDRRLVGRSTSPCSPPAASTSRALAPRVAAAGAGGHRQLLGLADGPEVPLVVPEVNAHALDDMPLNIVANPNCTTMVAMPVLKPLDLEAGLRTLVVSTYQAVSGAGLAGTAELDEQVRKVGDGAPALAMSGTRSTSRRPHKFPSHHRLQRDPVRRDRSSTTACTRPTRSTSSATRAARSSSCPTWPCPSPACGCRCTPATRCRSTPASPTTITPEQARRALIKAPGVELADVPTPADGRRHRPHLRRAHPRRPDPSEHGLSLFLSGDNLRKGAALNAVQIAEALLERRFRR